METTSIVSAITIPRGLFPALSSWHPKPLHLHLSSRERRISISRKRSSSLWKISVAESTDIVPELESSVEKVQQVIPAVTNDGIGTTVVSVLLTVAFVGLSILTIGVIYIAVTDFLQKREREKFEKEEEETAKKMKGKSKKKRKVNVRAGGPRGFGQKTTDADAEDQDDD
ncbi:hypothetical protein ZOSMA_379G00160 [Zostera marina]|uniref:Transmembrane protein n=1 Tax=Zostera marina TaxID=29655 RepID=A0A0K9P5H2_ZOSMR|nr:hypothetical protein ZOSMA_379G00160 [Zostera marina]